MFGEETGEFIDFTRWTHNSCKIKTISIVSVKAPRIGQMYPSEVIASIEISLKDLPQGAKAEWLTISANEPIFFVMLDKSEIPREADQFAKEQGIAMIRGCFVKGEKGKKIIEKVADKTEDDVWTIQVLLDPVQYKIDLETIVNIKSKLIEEIYSESQLLIRLNTKSQMR